MAKAARFLFIAAVVLMVLATGAHFAWKYSGSNKWEKVIDKNGVTIYTLKAPGDVVQRVRGVTRVRTTMNAAVDSMMQTSSEDCSTWFPSCKSIAAIQPWNSQDLSYIHLFRLRARGPFDAREVLIKARATQNPVTKAVLIDFMAMPDDLPQNDCCYRVSHMHNTWSFTPLDNGQVEVENRMNVDMGLPYFMFNRFAPRAQYRLLHPLQKYLDNPRWQQARYPSIQERADVAIASK
ncbi:MAG TPA: hypothetical protein VGF69_00340 [Thermoanaerobaculia bacterium]|jgi:hypothetical protein